MNAEVGSVGQAPGGLLGSLAVPLHRSGGVSLPRLVEPGAGKIGDGDGNGATQPGSVSGPASALAELGTQLAEGGLGPLRQAVEQDDGQLG